MRPAGQAIHWTVTVSALPSGPLWGTQRLEGEELHAATLMYGAGDVRVEDLPNSVVKLPTDALVRITGSCICGSDLWPYDSGCRPG